MKRTKERKSKIERLNNYDGWVFQSDRWGEYIQIKKDKIVETKELRDGLLADLNENGDIIGIEILK
jgi:hypothetical protein